MVFLIEVQYTLILEHLTIEVFLDGIKHDPQR